MGNKYFQKRSLQMPHYEIQITKTQQQVTVLWALLKLTRFPGSAEGDASGHECGAKAHPKLRTRWTGKGPVDP